MSVDGFHSQRLTVEQADALVNTADVFDRFEDFDASIPGDPGRRIPITPQVLAREAKLQAERERQVVTPAMEWRMKVALDAANLRTVPVRATAPGRVPNALRVARPQTPRVRHSGKFCAGKECTRELSYSTVGNLCQACRKLETAKVLPSCGKCGKPMRSKARNSTCLLCRRANHAEKAAEAKLAGFGVRPCGGGCGRQLRMDNRGGLCWVCGPLAKAAAKKAAGTHRLERFACEKGCGRLRRGGRGPGLCVKCKAKSRKAVLTPEQRRRYHANRNKRDNKRCGDCGVLIGHTAKTGYCRDHAPAHRVSKAKA